MFRGCTRPAMFLGVPYVPFFLGAGGCLLLAMYSNLLVLFALPVVVFSLRQMARRDDMVFRLLALRLRTRMKVRNLRRHGGAWAFTGNQYRKGAGTAAG